MHLYGRYVPRKPYDHEEKGCFVTWIINGLTPTLFPALIVVPFTIPLHRRFPFLLQVPIVIYFANLSTSRHADLKEPFSSGFPCFRFFVNSLSRHPHELFIAHVGTAVSPAMRTKGSCNRGISIDFAFLRS